MKLCVEGHYLKVLEASPVELSWLNDLLSWEGHQGAMTTVLMDGDGQSWFADPTFDKPEDLKTYAGLTTEIMKRASGKVDLTIEGMTDPGDPTPFTVDPGCLQGRTLRPHQIIAVKKALRGMRGILSLPTASGKTSILLAILKTLNPKQTFIIVPTTYLAEMLYEEALEFGFTSDQVGVLHGGRKELRPVVVAVSDSLHNSLKKMDKFGQALVQSDLMLGDECHHLGADTWREIWWASPALYKIGVTATPYSSLDGDPLGCKQDAMVRAVGGPTLYEVSNNYLIEKGLVAQTYCLYISMPGRMTMYGVSPAKLHTDQIMNNTTRNDKIIAAVRKARSYDMPVLIFVARKAHARILMEQLRDEKVICKFDGENSLQFAEDGSIENVKVTLSGPGSWVERYENGEWDVLISSPVLEEGVDIPEITFTIFAMSGRSLRKNVQRRGRGSRRKKDGEPNRAYMIDFTDRSHAWLYHQSRARRALFEATGTIILEDAAGKPDPFRFWRLVAQHAEIRTKNTKR